jgi:hypothetical protein
MKEFITENNQEKKRLQDYVLFFTLILVSKFEPIFLCHSFYVLYTLKISKVTFC